MRIVLFIGLLASYFCPLMLRAQVWSKKDSIWLSGVLSGKDTLRLNSETEEAIREGRLLNTSPQPAGEMRQQGSHIPLVVDFSDYVRKNNDTTYLLVPLKDLPPQVFWLYGRNLDPRDAMRYSAYDYDRETEEQGLSFAHLLNYAFSPSYRRKVKTRKNATAAKTYDAMPSSAMQQKQRAYRAAIRKRELRKKHAYLRYDEDGLPLPDIVSIPPDETDNPPMQDPETQVK